MNCCCDLECSEEEKKVFSYCLNSDFYEPKVTSPTSHSCFRTDIFYRENSPYLVRRTTGGLFCVVKENVEPSDELPSEPGVSWKNIHSCSELLSDLLRGRSFQSLRRFSIATRSSGPLHYAANGMLSYISYYCVTAN